MARLLLASLLLLLACGGDPEPDAAEPVAVSASGDEDPMAPSEGAPIAVGTPATCREGASIEPPSVATVPAPPDVAAPPPEAQVTPSGLASLVVVPGCGTTHPTAQSRVKVHYSGWTIDGEMFDSSVTRGNPATFPLDRVIEGWTEGVQLMVEGEQRRFWIPADLAYGNRPGRPQGMLVFDVDLIAIED